MEGFKSNAKMQCFKEGGSVAYKSRKQSKEDMSADVKQDKAIVKKAIRMHDEQEHKGEHTDLSKLKKGGRAKKEAGSVRKYKTGGAVENAYGAKKTDKDIKDIASAKRQKPQMLCGGRSVKKYEDGGSVLSNIATGARDAILGSPTQNAAASQNEAKYLKAKNLQEASGAAMSPGEKMAQNLAALGQKLQPAQAKKRGGKVKKMNTGGTAS